MTAVRLEECLVLLSAGRGSDKANPVRDEMDASVSYDDGWYSIRLPAKELLVLTDMLIEGLEQFDERLIAAQIGLSKAELRTFMLDFTGSMQAARQAVDS
jgi:hypothetical protein